MKKKPLKKRGRAITDGVEILDRQFYRGRPQRQAGLEEARLNAVIAREICALRIKANLTQKQLAELVGTTASVICRLEDADYEGHSLALLRRIAEALGRTVEVHFVPKGSVSRQAKREIARKTSGSTKVA